MTTGSSCSCRGMQSSSPNLPRSYAGVPRSLSASTSDNSSTQAFQAAAQFCDDQASNPTGLPPSDGCFPLLQDFG